MEHEINDTYFRRFLIPIVASILIMCGIAVIIATPPGTPVNWGAFELRQIAGAWRR
jgi:hypothetical protein